MVIKLEISQIRNPVEGHKVLVKKMKYLNMAVTCNLEVAKWLLKVYKVIS